MAQVDTIISRGCSTGIGKEENFVTLLQIAAQKLNTNNDSATAILQRARDSGIGCVEDQKRLLQIIAQYLN